MADDRLSARRLLAHACGVAALAAVAVAARLAGPGFPRVPRAEPSDDLPSLSVVVPARNEEANVERCVRSLLAQTLAVELVVVDDRSDDATPEILARLAAEEPRLRVVRGEPLPEGWVGKPWALEQGARVARGAWLLFTDADTWHAPEACASALRFALDRGIDALTLGTHQEMETWGERAALPTILGLVLLACGSPASLNDPYDPEHALANGQYVLVSRAAYAALGGHEALRGELVEDLAFARRVKRDGRYRLVIASGEALVRVRMYRSLRELWNGFTKNVYAGAEGDLRALFGGAAALALLSVVPAALAVDALARRRPREAVEPLAAIGTVVALQALGLSRSGLPARLALWAPVGCAIAAGVTLNSTLRVLSGRGVAWRGRRYPGTTPG